MTGIVTHSQIESLESRIAPAGLITVTFNNGALELTSDNGSHDFSLRMLDATTIQLLGTGGTLFHMDGSMDSDTLLLTAPIKSLAVTLGSDADSFQLSGVNVAGDITIDLGNGLNALTLDTISTKRGLEIKGGNAGDDIEVEGGLTSVKKDLVLDLGDGENGFHPQAALLDVGGMLAYTGGSGTDNISLDGTLKVKGSAEFKLGAGTNGFGSQVVLVSNLSVGKDLVFDSSQSTSAPADATTIQLSGLTLGVKGALRVLDGAGSLDVNPSVGPGLIAKFGSVNVVTGGGMARIGFSNAAITAKSVFVDASESSSSQLLVGGPVGGFSSNLTYIGGAGNDTVSMQLLGGVSVKGLSNLNLDLGNGDNSVQAFSFASFYKNVTVTGGTGTDGVLIAAVSATINNIVIDNGDGAAATQVQLGDSKVTGQIKVTNGTGAGPGTLSLAFLNSQIGGLSYTSDLATNEIGFGIGAGFFASNGFTIKKAVEITTGNGNDSVGFQNLLNATFSKGIKLALGDGENEVEGFFSNSSFKSVSVTGGSGTDNVVFVGTGKLGAVDLSLGAGINTTALVGQTVPLAISSLTVVSESTGTDVDGLTLARVQVLGKFAAAFGANTSNLKIDDSVIGGPVTVDTGDGNDFVLIDVDDSNAGTLLAKPVNIVLGEGDDALSLGGMGASRQVTTKSTFTADGGSGTNTLVNDDDNVFAKDPVFTSLTQA